LVRRFLLNFLCILLPLFCLFLLLCWFRSYLPPNWRWYNDRGRFVLLFWDGTMPPSSLRFDPANERFVGPTPLLAELNQKNTHRFLGISFIDGHVYTSMPLVFIIIPIWLPLIVGIALSTLFILARRRIYHRLKSGHCLQCGYDLRESKDNCPECGTPILAPLTANRRAV
jgi:hypothetical protein